MDIPRDPIPESYFGRDHWSTLVYIESRCVDYQGKPDNRHMRTDRTRHPGMCFRSIMGGSNKGEVNGHDDWDCVDDLAAAGYLIIEGTGIFPVYTLTDKGWETVGRIRRHGAEGGSYSTFTLEVKE